MKKQGLEIDADSPETNPDLDELNYRPLAESIANGINSMCPADGMVIGILGGWGYGKTTTINYILELLRRKKSKVKTVAFNPWWFSGHEDLVRQLLQDISDCVQPEVKGSEELRNALADLAGAVEWKPKVLGAEIDMKEVFGSRAKTLVSSKSVPAIKERIGKLLKKHNLKILCVVDDVDRLSAEEVRDLFRCIKAIGNLPNVVYLLAFDPVVVSEALDEVFKNRGKDYLDKIIQVPFHLPPPNPDDITALVDQGISELLNHLGVTHFDYSRLSQLYQLGIRHLVQSPRDIVRLINALKVTLPSVYDEVNPSDYIALEAIRLFLPKVYEVIRKNKDEFADLLTAQFGRSSSDSLKEFHNSWMSEVPSVQQKWLKDFLSELFPKLHTVWANSFHSKEQLIRWRKSLRVCSPEIFDAYFTFSPPPKTISARELNQILIDLDFARSLDFVRERIHSENSDDQDWVWRLLLRLGDHVDDELKPIAAERLFRFLLESFCGYKHSVEVFRHQLLVLDNSDTLDKLLWRLFERVSAERRTSMLIEVLNQSFAVTPMVTFLRQLCKRQGVFGGDSESPSLLSSAALTDVLKVFAGSLQRKVEANEFLRWEDYWMSISFLSLVDEACMPWFAAKLQESDEGSVALMLFGGGKTYSIGTPKRKTNYTVDLERIRSLLEPSHLIPTAENIVASNSKSQSEKDVANEFLKCMQAGQSSARHQFDDDDDIS